MDDFSKSPLQPCARCSFSLIRRFRFPDVDIATLVYPALLFILVAGFSLNFFFSLAGRASKPHFSLARKPFHWYVFLNICYKITVFSNLCIFIYNSCQLTYYYVHICF